MMLLRLSVFHLNNPNIPSPWQLVPPSRCLSISYLLPWPNLLQSAEIASVIPPRHFYFLHGLPGTSPPSPHIHCTDCEVNQGDAHPRPAV